MLESSWCFLQRVEVPSTDDGEGLGEGRESWTSPWIELRSQLLCSPEPWLQTRVGKRKVGQIQGQRCSFSPQRQPWEEGNVMPALNFIHAWRHTTSYLQQLFCLFVCFLIHAWCYFNNIDTRIFNVYVSLFKNFLEASFSSTICCSRGKNVKRKLWLLNLT